MLAEYIKKTPKQKLRNLKNMILPRFSFTVGICPHLKPHRKEANKTIKTNE